MDCPNCQTEMTIKQTSLTQQAVSIAAWRLSCPGCSLGVTFQLQLVHDSIVNPICSCADQKTIMKAGGDTGIEFRCDECQGITPLPILLPEDILAIGVPEGVREA